MRGIALTHKKIRGIPRRLRYLRRWAESFVGHFPKGLTESDRYYNYKLPMLSSLIEGNNAIPDVQRQCAQGLIDACSLLIQAKPKTGHRFHTVATICLPNMFSSEVCIYTNEQYLQSRTKPSNSPYGRTTLLLNRSLAEEWGLVLPIGMQELGVLTEYWAYEEEAGYIREEWYFGELPGRSE